MDNSKEYNDYNINMIGGKIYKILKQKIKTIKALKKTKNKKAETKEDPKMTIMVEHTNAQIVESAIYHILHYTLILSKSTIQTKILQEDVESQKKIQER